MNIEKISYTILSESAAVTDLVADRIYPLVVPEAVQLPAVIYNVIESREHRSLAQPTEPGARLVTASLRFTALVAPNDYGTLTAIMDAIRRALNGRSGTNFAGAYNVVVHSGQEGPDAYDYEAQIASRSRVVRVTFNLPS